MLRNESTSRAVQFPVARHRLRLRAVVEMQFLQDVADVRLDRALTDDCDPLYRLTNADYSTGNDYNYTYDAVGNRLTQQIGLVTTNYVYDNANRLASVNGVTYTFDANGNLLNDGVNAYSYDSANRLRSVSNQSTVSSYQYNGLGDRLQVWEDYGNFTVQPHETAP